MKYQSYSYVYFINISKDFTAERHTVWSTSWRWTFVLTDILLAKKSKLSIRRQKACSRSWSTGLTAKFWSFRGRSLSVPLSCVSDVILSFSVLMTEVFLMRGGMNGAMIEASKRVMGKLEGNATCSSASFSIVSQNSSTWTSSVAWKSGHVNYRERRTVIYQVIVLYFTSLKC